MRDFAREAATVLMNWNIVCTAAGAWMGFAVIAILNGGLREAVLLPLVGPGIAHLLSTLLLVAAMLLAVLALVARPWASLGRRALFGIGASWMGLTIAFEFLFGHFVMGASWASLLAAYDVLQGRVWVLVPVTLLLGPLLVRRLLDARGHRSRRVAGTALRAR